jgi:hypothetical protein
VHVILNISFSYPIHSTESIIFHFKLTIILCIIFRVISTQVFEIWRSLYLKFYCFSHPTIFGKHSLNVINPNPRSHKFSNAPCLGDVPNVFPNIFTHLCVISVSTFQTSVDSHIAFFLSITFSYCDSDLLLCHYFFLF